MAWLYMKALVAWASPLVLGRLLIIGRDRTVGLKPDDLGIPHDRHATALGMMPGDGTPNRFVRQARQFLGCRQRFAATLRRSNLKC